MWDERTRAHITRELQQIERLLSEYETLLDDARTMEPDLVKRTALGAVLQSFYNGIEGIFQTIAKRVDQDVPAGETWHKDLLQQMGRATETRGPVISSETVEQLEPYLGFRHVSRHAYTFNLEWRKMQNLVGELMNVWRAFYSELQTRLDTDSKV